MAPSLIKVGRHDALNLDILSIVDVLFILEAADIFVAFSL